MLSATIAPLELAGKAVVIVTLGDAVLVYALRVGRIA